MKASELIKELANLIDEYGDMRVAVCEEMGPENATSVKAHNAIVNKYGHITFPGVRNPGNTKVFVVSCD